MSAPLSLQHPGVAFAFDELHRDVALASVETHIVDRDDVRVVESRGGARFFQELVESAGLVRHLFRKNFVGHLAIEKLVGRFVNGASSR